MRLEIVFGIIIICIASFASGASTNKGKKQLEKRVELEGIYRIQDPNSNNVVTITSKVAGDPPLRLIKMKPLKEGSMKQEWTIITSGPPVARVASIFHVNDTQNVLSNEFGYLGTSFTRAWHALDNVGNGLIVLRNLGQCLTRIEGEDRKIERNECNKGDTPTEAQKWKLVFIEPSTTPPPPPPQ